MGATALSAATVALAPGPAEARVTNVWTSDELGAAETLYRPWDTLYISGTADLNGPSIACVVDQDVLNGDCRGLKKWGPLFPIGALQLGFTFYGVPLTAYLPEGDFRVLVDDPTTGDVVSSTFTVDACHEGESCPTVEIGPEMREEIALREGECQAGLLTTGCALSFIIKTAPGTIATYSYIQSTGFALPGGLAGTIGVSVAAGAVAAVALPPMEPKDSTVEAVADYFCKGHEAAIRDLRRSTGPELRHGLSTGPSAAGL